MREFRGIRGLTFIDVYPLWFLYVAIVLRDSGLCTVCWGSFANRGERFPDFPIFKHFGTLSFRDTQCVRMPVRAEAI